MNGNVNKEVELILMLGSNRGHRKKSINKAVELLERRIGKVIHRSHFYETSPWGKQDQPKFINLGLSLRTSNAPNEVLKTILNIEKEVGRTRENEEKWGERVIDIDIILMNGLKVNTENLQIPHPQMQHRKFVLIPLNEIVPLALHPVFKRTINELLMDCEDNEVVNKLKN